MGNVTAGECPWRRDCGGSAIAGGRRASDSRRLVFESIYYGHGFAARMCWCITCNHAIHCVGTGVSITITLSPIKGLSRDRKYSTVTTERTDHPRDRDQRTIRFNGTSGIRLGPARRESLPSTRSNRARPACLSLLLPEQSIDAARRSSPAMCRLPPSETELQPHSSRFMTPPAGSNDVHHMYPGTSQLRAR